MTTDKYEQADEIGRLMILQDFQGNIKAYELQPQFSSHDLDITGKTGIETSIEVKVRGKFKLIENFSGCTYLKKLKIEHFRAILKAQENRLILFIIYYNNGVLCFNMTQRILTESQQLQTSRRQSTKNTVYDCNQTICEEELAVLSINPDYGDQIYYYQFNQGRRSLKPILNKNNKK